MLKVGKMSWPMSCCAADLIRNCIPVIVHLRVGALHVVLHILDVFVSLSLPPLYLSLFVQESST